MREVEVINGSWVQTIAYILYDIDNKLNDTTIEDIIRRIEERFTEDISFLKSDNNNIKENVNIVLDKLKELNDIKSDNDKIKYDVTSVMNRLNSISVVNQIVIKQPVTERTRNFRPRTETPRQNIQLKQLEKEHNCKNNETFMMDMDLTSGYTEQYKIIIQEGVHTYDWRLSWLISGNKRKLLYKGELTEDILSIYKKLGIVDIDIIKKARLDAR